MYKKMKKDPTRSSSKGFTLIELLVVVAIIGTLASIVMVSVNDLRARSRDDRRAADMKAYRDALAMYQIQNIAYPLEPTGAPITGTDTMSQALVSGKLLPAPIKDPVNTGQYIYTYQSLSDGASYVITFCMETSSLRDFTQGCNNQITP